MMMMMYLPPNTLSFAECRFCYQPNGDCEQYSSRWQRRGRGEASWEVEEGYSRYRERSGRVHVGGELLREVTRP